MNTEIIQLVIVSALVVANFTGLWYLNRLWDKEKSQKKESSSFGRSH